MASTLLRRATGLALVLSVVAGTGCSFLRAAGETIAEEEAADSRSPARGSPDSAGLEATRPGAGRAGDDGEGAARTAYVVSPALTWGALQLERPHALTGFASDQASLWVPQCRLVPRAPSEISQQPDRSLGEGVTRGGPAWVGVGGNVVTRGMAFSLDRDVVADRALRSGALLARRGPVCVTSLFFYLVVFGGDGSAAREHW
jgi:hypothetical protein